MTAATGLWTVVSRVTTTSTPETLFLSGTVVVSPERDSINTATITATPTSSTPRQQPAPPRTPQEADRPLAKTVNDPTPNVGDTVTYIVTISGKGPNAATNVRVTDLTSQRRDVRLGLAQPREHTIQHHGRMVRGGR